ncbi:hypothetical protein OG874_21620 [Nocardia sp. NBC_00565]|uniref:hypothetical protein n=1 Tax=Nocardia sp. NBC_00565 TaxID=2975993 RepID=UPI002E818A0C|nr:hypothetical protein [Nocardia sp. NBC_00565]WUC07525.1 hypothetical protein OG874_21620 [Nocardia sp. NBC_00565]
MTDFRVRLANAIAVRGYATVDLCKVQRTPFVPLQKALDSAASGYATIVEPNWQAAINHFINLKVLNIDTLSIRARDKRILLVVNRGMIGGNLEIEEALNYHASMSQWLDTLSSYLPDLELSETEAANVHRAQDWVGRWTGQNAVGWMAAKLVGVLYKSKGKGCCVTVHPIGSSSESFTTRWASADLTTERFISPKIQSSNYLWNVSENSVTPGGASGFENPGDFNFEPWSWDLRSLLLSVNDQ